MNDKDALIETLKQELNQADADIHELRDELQRLYTDKHIELERIGSLTEAAQRVNSIFEAAQREAEEYLAHSGLTSSRQEESESVAMDQGPALVDFRHEEKLEESMDKIVNDVGAEVSITSAPQEIHISDKAEEDKSHSVEAHVKPVETNIKSVVVQTKSTFKETLVNQNWLQKFFRGIRH